MNAGDAEALRALFARRAMFVLPNGEQVSGLDHDGGMELGVWQFDEQGKIVNMWVYAP